MSHEQKKIIASGQALEERKQHIEKNRASKQEILEATRKGIDRYKDVLKNLAKR